MSIIRIEVNLYWIITELETIFRGVYETFNKNLFSERIYYRKVPRCECLDVNVLGVNPIEWTDDHMMSSHTKNFWNFRTSI